MAGCFPEAGCSVESIGAPPGLTRPSACSALPLPVPELGAPRECGGRRSQQRVAQRSRIRFELREMIAALNWMHSGSFSTEPSVGGGCRLCDPFVDARLCDLLRHAGRLGSLSHPPSCEAALRELLAGRDDYHSPSSPVGLAPYNLELISLPDDVKQAPYAVDLLGEDDRRYLLEQERMLRPGPASESRAPDPYWDPALRHSPRRYRQFIKKLDSIGYLKYTLHPSAHAGVFFVYKSDKRRLRMIIDARPANALFLEPPGVDLSTSETFARMQYLSDEGMSGGHADEQGIFVALSDVRDCFHRVKQPDWLCKHFCFLPIAAKHLGMVGLTLDGQVLEPETEVFPMPGSLAMGFSWSLFFAQRISERLMSQVPSLQHSKLAVDRGEPICFSAQVQDEAYHYVYVDNLGVLSRSHDVVARGLVELTEIFNRKGLLLHAGEVGHENIQTLGVSLDGVNLTTSLTPERFHRVRQGVRGLLRRGKCSGKLLEVVIGHCTYCGLLHRGTLSVFHAVYKFIQRHYSDTVKLWPSVKIELRVFAGLMPFLVSDWSRPWNDKVFISDASEEGFGICAAAWPIDEVRKAGAIKERLRFRRSGGHNARESALTAAGFVRDIHTGAWRASELPAEEYLETAGWEINQDFPEINGSLLARDWETVQAGEWARAEHIVHLEARALVKSFEACLDSCRCRGSRQLMLFDSMSAALAFERGRSRNFKMLRQIRKLYGHALLWNVDVHFRWVPSELNPADGPSRLSSKVESKTLLRSLPLYDADSLHRDWAEEGSDFAAGLRDSFTTGKAKQDAGTRKRDTRILAKDPNPGGSRPYKGVEQQESQAAAQLGDCRRGLPRGETGEGHDPLLGQFEQHLRASCSEASAAALDEAFSTPCSEVRVRGDGSAGSGAVVTRAEGRDRQDRGLLHQGVRRVHGLCAQDARSHRKKHGGESRVHGRGVGEALQQSVHVRTSGPPRGQGSCLGHAPSPLERRSCRTPGGA